MIERILSEVADCVRQVSTESLIQAAALMDSSPRIFVAGAGRSGLCMRAFAMRLMHLGKTVYVAGETTTPSVAAADLLILGSGSGRTASLLAMAEQARRRGAQVLLFTTDAGSPLAELSDLRVIIPAPSFRVTDEVHDALSIQPLGTLFEQTMFVLCDSLIVGLMQRTGVSAAQMFERHANLE
ncbi:MAG: 6-phospho-3-hexuloisomerase [Chloroflexi bacterium]|nr:MAG: 6-phospho-3-hexuloisomerase [Chloroflexota bacterium]